MAGAARPTTGALPDGIRLVRSRTDLAPSFHAALDAVARERRWLALLEAPPLGRVERFVADVIAEHGIQWFAIDAADRVVGWCDILRNPLPAFHHGGRLGVGVVAAWRGQGLGRTLCTVALDDAWSEGIERVELEVFPSNAHAIALYASLGFAREGVRRCARRVDGVYEDVVLMAALARR
jgi:RimJ/RimL family protein N-acetyltransferase